MNIINFNDFNIDDELLESIDILGFTKPTEVQKKVIPIALDKKDIIVKSQTGSGKTAAFAIPICQMIDWDENKPQALVLTPTRELATQVREDIFNIGRFKRIKALAVYGQAPFYYQEIELKQKTHVVVGTPGRTMDHIEKKTLDTSEVKYLIIDEADEMFNMGFIEQIEAIIDTLPKARTTMLFSATMPRDIESLCHKYMKDPTHVEIEGQSLTVDRIDQELYEVEDSEKIQLLKDVTIVENPDSCIVFCNTREMVEEVYVELMRAGYSCNKIHGGMEQRDRTKVMEDFKQGYFRYLVATDVAARGIDVDDISHVINYDIPRDVEPYVHRIGRTGRVGRQGKSITFAGQREKRFLNDIRDYIGKDLIKKEVPDKETIDRSKTAFYEKMKEKPEIKDSKAEELSQGIMKLHINAGRKTKMRPVDIVGTLCNIEGMSADDIGIINILDISTFVEILNGKGDMVLEELQSKTIKGRIRNVNKANEQF